MKKYILIALMMVSCVSISKAQFFGVPSLYIESVSSYYITFSGGLQVPVDDVPYGGFLANHTWLPKALYDAFWVRKAYWGPDMMGFMNELGYEKAKLGKLKELIGGVKSSSSRVSKAQKKADAKKAAENYKKRRAAAASNGTDTSRVRTVKVDSNGVHAVSDGSEYDFSF
jgi:hypothetical protein